MNSTSQDSIAPQPDQDDIAAPAEGNALGNALGGAPSRVLPARVPATRGNRLVADVVDPALREPFASVFFTPAIEIPAVVARARAAAGSWEALSAARRAQTLAALRRLIARHAAVIAETISRSMGKPLLEALWYDVAPVLRTLDRCIGRPRGSVEASPPVVCVLAPISLPFERVMSPAIEALAGGSAVIVKPSENAGLLGGLMARLFDEAFDEVPALVQVVQGGRLLGTLLATAEDVDRVIFCGARASARRLRAVLAPLQRSAVLLPLATVFMIVCEDANLERAANAAVFGRFSNNGQGGGSVDRIYVHRAVAAEFEHKVVHKVRALKAGPYVDTHCELGPLASAHAMPHLRALLQDAVDQRATVRTGGRPPRVDETPSGVWRPPSREGFYWPATVLSDVAPSTRVMHEETFGPILAIATVQDEQEAVTRANDATSGFGACVFARSQERATRIAGLLEVRWVAINDAFTTADGPGGWDDEQAPGAGHRANGDAQQVRLGNGEVDREPAWFPYSPAKLRAVEGALDRLAAQAQNPARDLGLLGRLAG